MIRETGTYRHCNGLFLLKLTVSKIIERMCLYLFSTNISGLSVTDSQTKQLLEKLAHEEIVKKRSQNSEFPVDAADTDA